MLTQGRELPVLVALLNLEFAGALELPRKPQALVPWTREAKDQASAIVLFPVSADVFTHPVERAVYEAVSAGHGSEQSIAGHGRVVAAIDEAREPRGHGARVLGYDLAHAQEEPTLVRPGLL